MEIAWLPAAPIQPLLVRWHAGTVPDELFHVVGGIRRLGV